MTGPKRSSRLYPCGLYTTLGVVACIGFAVAVWDLTMGGFYFRVLGVPALVVGSVQAVPHRDGRDRGGPRDS